MAELIITDQAIENEIVSEDEKVIKRLILENPAQEYDKLLAEVSWKVFYELSSFREGLLNWYSFKKECSILQLSCGYGALTGLLAGKAKKIVVLENVLERAKCIAQRYHHLNNVQVVAGNITDLFSDEQFDYVFVEQTSCVLA